MAKTGLKLTELDEKSLSILALEGNQGAFLVLYDRYKVSVSQYVGQFFPVREEAEDIVLESFQKAFSQIDSYNAEYKFSTWLFRIARNTAFDHLDKIGRQSHNMPMNSIDDVNSGLGEISATTGNPEADVIRGQEYDKLVAAIGGLSETYRLVAQMILLDNYGYQEVAESLELPLNTVKTRVKRAKEMLTRIMESEDDENG